MMLNHKQCYRTTPNNTLQVYTGWMPLYIEAEGERWKYEERKRGNTKTMNEATAYKLRRWQEDWDGGRTGRMTQRILREVDTKGWRLEWKGRQLLSGHGSFLSRFRISAENDQCECGGDSRSKCKRSESSGRYS